jgi:hypothetical protein
MKDIFKPCLTKKGKKIGFYMLLVFHFLVSVAGIVMFGILSKRYCSYSDIAGGNQCPEIILETFGICPTPYDMKMDSPLYKIHLYCPWYDRDIGLGIAALAVSIIFGILSGVKSFLKSSIFRLARLGVGFVAFALLVAMIILEWIDLVDHPSPPDLPYTTFGIHAHAANAALVIVSWLCVCGLAALEIKKLVKKAKSGNGKQKVTKIPDSSPQTLEIETRQE